MYEWFVFLTFAGFVFTVVAVIHRSSIFVFMSAIGVMIGLVNITSLEKKSELSKQAEKNMHSNFLNLVEGRYALDSVVTSDSTKIQFILRLPGIAERKVEVIAYDDHPSIYWNEWQAEGAQPGDTLIVSDIWSNDSTYNRLIQKMDASQIGLGYISNEWLIEHSYEEPPKK